MARRERHLTVKHLCGEWRDGTDAWRGHSFHPGHGKRNIATVDKENVTVSHSVVSLIFKLMCCLKLTEGGIMNEESPRDTKTVNRDIVGFQLWTILACF